jgi:hypothetical protein
VGKKETDMKNAMIRNSPNRMMGLGQCPSIDMLKSCLGSRFDSVPVIEYVTWTIQLPVPDAAVESTFGNTINLFGNSTSVAGVAAVDSSFVVNGILQTDMFVIGFGAHVFAEPKTFSQIGNSIAPVAGTLPPSPDVFTQSDQDNGALGPAFASGAVQFDPAVIEWGAPAWNASWNLANAYRFVWTFNQRQQIVDEMLADVSYFSSYADSVAAGDSDLPIHPYVQQVNAIYAALCGACAVAPAAFWPVNFRRVGSVQTFGGNSTDNGEASGGGTSGGAPAFGNVGDFHPTRDFDLAPVTWGGITNGNGKSNGVPYRKLPRPCLLERGIPIGFELQASNQIHLNRFQSQISASGAPLNGNGSIPEFDAPTGGSGGFTTAPTGPGMPIMTELTLDPTPVLISQQVQVGRRIFKGGVLKISFLLKGYEVMRDWCAFLTGCDAAGNLYMTSSGGTPAGSASGGMRTMTQ